MVKCFYTYGYVVDKDDVINDRTRHGNAGNGNGFKGNSWQNRKSRVTITAKILCFWLKFVVVCNIYQEGVKAFTEHHLNKRINGLVIPIYTNTHIIVCLSFYFVHTIFSSTISF